MKKVFLIFLSCFLIFGCYEKNGDVKKESLEKTNTNIDSKKITVAEYKEIKKEEKFQKIIENTMNEYGLTKEIFTKTIDDVDEKINSETDDFNRERKITPIGEKKTDKIKIEAYEYDLKDNSYLDDFYIRGNITFSCVNNQYFSFDRIIVLTDENRYEIKGDVFSRDSNFENGKSYQNVKYVIDGDKQLMISDIANSKNVKIRFTKNDNNLDFTLSDEEIARIAVMNDYFICALITKDIFNKVQENL